MTASELNKALAEKNASLQKFRFEVAGGKVTNIKFARNTKKDIARILTALQNIKQDSKV